ncbi:hypothetical protein M1K46_17105 [Fictibacillus sp. WQ 8-8]|uniref:hypothetical protein n=1 Tax=unclassified Fictibacillus TaxID=2644029 RepID=UPI00210CE578|nr:MULTISPECIES: hypothetical protein [unclassified Fictibacillus]MCQ6267357.1 hypothetical protein [Fictibacillus sp. WQ 8-8]MED2974836.1 hypothetical protein [Fictibacillus sp. B-59209]
MLVRDEVNPNINIRISPSELLKMLQFMKTKKEQEIERIKNKINKYVQKKNAEDAFYQSLSPFRKLFTGRSPSHHQAVEYIAHVKEPLKQIDKLKQGLFELDHSIHGLKEEPSKDEIILSRSIIGEIKMNRKSGKETT